MRERYIIGSEDKMSSPPSCAVIFEPKFLPLISKSLLLRPINITKLTRPLTFKAVSINFLIAQCRRPKMIKPAKETLTAYVLYCKVKSLQIIFKISYTVGGPLFCNLRTRKSHKIRGTLQNKGPVPLILYKIRETYYAFRIVNIKLV